MMGSDIFISYSHKDTYWLERLTTTLKPLARRGEISIFSDLDIQTGTQWREAIQQALDSAEVAILLVSQDFLASDFIAQHEIAPLLKAAEEKRLKIFWIAVRYSTYADTDIERFKAANNPSQPLASFLPHELDRELVQIYQKIKVAIQEQPHPAPPPSPISSLPPCPYPGLKPFDESDAPYFHGRREEIQEMVEAVDRFRFLMVLGPSGSGKSSLVFAGLLPHLKQQNSYTLHSWTVLTLRPQKSPATNLNRRLSGVLEKSGEAVARYLASQSGASRLLLIVDQFEEFFTQAEKKEQKPFLTMIQNLREVEACTVVLTLRAVFFEDLMLSGLWPVEASDRIEVTPLREDAMREAIVEPARKAGVKIDEGLVELLLADAAGEPGRLPLLQATMNFLWDKVQDGELSLEAYKQLGEKGRQRVAYALARKAEDALDSLSSSEQQVARRVFLRLIQFVEGRPDTRRQQPISALLDAAEDPAIVKQTVSKLAAHGLLVVDPQEEGQPVDLAHDALITAWPTLRDWLAQERRAEQARRRWEAKAAEWLQYGEDALLGEKLLRELETWLQSQAAASVRYSPLLTKLVEASRKALAAKGGDQRRVLAGDLAARAEALLESDPDLALRLATEAVTATWRQDQPPLAQAEDVLRLALVHTPVRKIVHDHRGEVLSMAVSPDGKLLATAGADGTAKVWHVDSGQLKESFSGHAGPVYGVAFDPEAPCLATAGADATIRVWELGECKQPIRWSGHEGAVTCVAYSPTGHHLVTGGEDAAGRIWNVARQEVQVNLQGHRRPIRKVLFSPGGDSVAAVGDDAIVRIWNASTGAETAALLGHVNRVWDVAWGGSAAKFVATAGEDRTVRVWNRQNGALHAMQRHAGPVRSVKFGSSDRLLTASEDGTVQILDMENNKTFRTFRCPGVRLIGATYAQSDEVPVVLATSADNTTWLWEDVGGQELSILSINEAERLGRTVYSPAGSARSLLVSASPHRWPSAIGNTQVRDTESGAVLASLQYVVERATSASYVRQGTSGPSVAHVQERHPDSGAVQTTIPAHAGGVNSSEYSPDGKWIATAGQDHTARIWEAKNRQAVTSLAGHMGPVKRISWSPDSRWVVTASEDRTARIWEAMPSRWLRTLMGHTASVQAAVFSLPDGRWIATASADGTARIWSGETGDLLHELKEHSASVTDVVSSPEGSFVATASEDGTVRIWSWEREQSERILSHEGGVLGIAWSPDGRTLATAGKDGTVRLWDAPTGQRRSTLRGHTDAVVGVAFSPDGKRVVSTGADRTIRQYLVDIDALLEAAGARNPRELSPAERITYLGEPASASPEPSAAA